MSEIEKFYENAGIKKVKDYYCPNCETKLEDWFGKHKELVGQCSEERSMIHPDYARNFICDFILGKTQHNLLQGKLF